MDNVIEVPTGPDYRMDTVALEACLKEAEANIVCFRFLGDACGEIDELQKGIRARILESEDFYLVQTDLGGRTFLRCTLINPLTEIEHLKALLDLIRDAAHR